MVDLCAGSEASLIYSSPVKHAGSAEKNQSERWMWNAVNFSDFPVTHVMIPFALPLQANLDIYQKFDEIMLQRPENIFLCCKPEAWGSTAAAQGPVATMRPSWLNCFILEFRYWRHLIWMSARFLIPLNSILTQTLSLWIGDSMFQTIIETQAFCRFPFLMISISKWSCLTWFVSKQCTRYLHKNRWNWK